MRYVILLLMTAVIGAAAYSTANAGSNCQTTCQRGYGGQQVCNTHCY